MSTDTKKDVIYIDIEDDITSVIEKVKGAKASIVALVPPKRIGVLQSVVNLKLLHRAANSAGKRVVLITSDQALTGLAAVIAIPVAKNLQSKPEVPVVVSEQIDDDEVINGDELPIGELQKTDDKPLELTGFPAVAGPGAAAASAPFAAKAAARAPKKLSVPDFDKFRKKLFLLGGLGVLLVAFLVWAIFFAGHATVAITAKTNIVNINKPLELRPDAKLDAAQALAPAVIKETKKTTTVPFTATGKKDVGDKATGKIDFANNTTSAITVKAGTQLVSSSSLPFILDADATVPAGAVSCSTIFNCTGTPGKATGTVTAGNSGSKYNAASGSLTGSPNGTTATFDGPSSGGTDKTVTVVSQGDVDKAKEQLQTQDNAKVKTELQKAFDATTVIIQESFIAKPGEPSSSPAVGQEATDAKLSAETVFQMVGIARSDLRSIYDTFTKTQIDEQNSQKIYVSGDEATRFSEFKPTETGFSVRAQSAAQVGPNIDDKALALKLVGKRSGEIQQQIESIQGVEDVNVSLSPFWVTKAPKKADKITIEFVVKHGQN